MTTTTRTTTTLYSLARRESDSETWFDLLSGVERRQFVNRLAQDGVDRAAADRIATEAWHTAERVGDEALVTVGDLFEYGNLGPHRESYRVLATCVRAPLASIHPTR